MSEDPMIEAVAQLMATILAMHMTPDALAKAAWSSNAVADRQEAIDAAGAVVLGPGHDHQPAVFRALAKLYSMGHAAALERARTAAEPKPAICTAIAMASPYSPEHSRRVGKSY